MGWTALEPEVAGGWGERTVADTSTHPPRVTALHYEFDGWLGDDLVESFPCYIVTRRLGERLRAADLTGFRIGTVEVSASARFTELYPGQGLPQFEWLQVVGEAGHDDFGVSPDYRLVVSDRALALLRAGKFRHCDVSDWTPEV